MIDIPSLTGPEVKRTLSKIAKFVTDYSTVVEVGIFIGGTFCHLGQEIISREIQPKLFAIDTWRCDNISKESMINVNCYGRFLEQFRHNLQITGLHKYTNVIISDSINAAPQFANGSIDFLMLDGSHAYPYIENELNTWLPKMGDNSLLMGHDYCNSEDIKNMVSQYFKDIFMLTQPNNECYLVKLGDGGKFKNFAL